MLAKERAKLFWGVCIPLRSAIALYAMQERRRWLRLVAAVIGVRWMAGMEVGDEGMFGGKAWWKEERPLHGLLWAGYAASGNGSLLAIDTAFGMYNWVSTVPK